MSKSKSTEDIWTVVYFDGAAEPTNPGPAAGASVLDLPNGESITVTVDIGFATNNEAEYQGCIAGLKKALELGVNQIKVFGDSQLVICQLQGVYQVKAPHLRPLNQEARSLLLQFEHYQLDWIPRAQNSRADAAAGGVLQSPLPLVIPIPTNLPIQTPREGLKGKIEQLIRQGEKASFKDVLSLKSGRDNFSSLRGDALIAAIPDEVKQAVAASLHPTEDTDFVAKCYRWWLRGLPVPLALRKVRVDAEVTANIARR